MTTIAYKDGIIAYDSRITKNFLIVTDDRDKCTVRSRVSFILCGCVPDYAHLIDMWFNPKLEGAVDCHGYAVTETGELYEIGEEEVLWKLLVRRDEVSAIGSGRDFALAAMDLGESAVGAVEFAATRDVLTGGTVRTINLLKG